MKHGKCKDNQEPEMHVTILLNEMKQAIPNFFFFDSKKTFLCLCDSGNSRPVKKAD